MLVDVYVISIIINCTKHVVGFLLLSLNSSHPEQVKDAQRCGTKHWLFLLLY
jgi:hypothetical protein